MVYFRLNAAGIVTSPNYPKHYPHKLLKNYRIEVEQGLQLIIQFTYFKTEGHASCLYDHLNITDGDGTTLMGKTCGSPASLPANVTSRSNVINLVFKTDGSGTAKGWRVRWNAVRAGM